MNQEKRPISLEDIIRLKRAERPPAEFWERFDRELRAKQLAALVEKGPWWRSLPRAFSGFKRYHLPLGATAILAITFVATRDHSSAGSVKLPAPVAAVTAPAERAETVLAMPVVTPVVVANAGGTAMVAVAEENSGTDNAVPSGGTRIAAEENDSAVPARRELQDTPSSRFIAENLKAAQAAESAITRGLLSGARGFEIRGLVAKATVEPLAQMTTPAKARQAKFNAPISATSFTTDNSLRTSERAASRLSDEQLYDRVSRFRANGDVRGIGLGTRL
jgi:hypothetical protein